MEAHNHKLWPPNLLWNALKRFFFNTFTIRLIAQVSPQLLALYLRGGGVPAAASSTLEAEVSPQLLALYPRGGGVPAAASLTLEAEVSLLLCVVLSRQRRGSFWERLHTRAVLSLEEETIHSPLALHPTDTTLLSWPGREVKRNNYNETYNYI